MPPPVVTRTASEVYAELGGWTKDDTSYTLLQFCDWLVGDGRLDDVVQLVRDDGAIPGFAKYLQLETVPDAFVPWLAQFVGVITTTGLSSAAQRNEVSGVRGFGRGSVASIHDAAFATLTGTQQVAIHERDTGPYHMTVATYAAETPDPTATEAAIRAMKPAGIVLVYQLASGATYAALDAGFTTYAAMDAFFPTYEQQTLWIP